MREVIASGAFGDGPVEVPLSFDFGPVIGTATVQATQEGLVVTATVYRCRRCKDTGVIWDGQKMVRCPECK